MQLSLYKQLVSEGEALKREGMNRAVTHAENENPGWKEKCWSLFLEWIGPKPDGFEFKIETFRTHLERNGKIESPPSKRAFGYISVKASKLGLIEFVDHVPVSNKNAHGAWASLWRKR